MSMSVSLLAVSVTVTSVALQTVLPGRSVDTPPAGISIYYNYIQVILDSNIKYVYLIVFKLLFG